MEILSLLGDNWKPIAAIITMLLTALGLYVKGRNDGTVKGKAIVKDNELAAKDTIIKSKEHNAKTDQQVDDAFRNVPQSYTD